MPKKKTPVYSSSEEDNYYDSGSASEGEWEEVGQKQKQQKEKKKAQREEERKAIAAGMISSRDRQSQESEKFMKQYAQLANKNLLTLASGSFYDLIDLDDNGQPINQKSSSKKKSKEESQHSQLIVGDNGEFKGEKLVFIDTPSTTKPTASKASSKPKKSTTAAPSSSASKPTLEQACKKITSADISAWIEEVEGYSEVEAQINVIVNRLEQTTKDSSASPREVQDFYNHPEQPLAKLPSSCSPLKKWAATLSPEEASGNLRGMVKVLSTISHDYQKKVKSGTKGIGIQMGVQLIVNTKPQTLLFVLDDIKKNTTKNQLVNNHSVNFLIWLSHQAMSSPSVALTVWFQFLFPLLFDSTKKEFHDSILSLLDDIISDKSSVIMDETTATMAYERMLLLHASGKEAPAKWNAYRQKLMDKKFLYRKPGKTDKKFFLMLLGHGATENHALRDQVLPSLLDSIVEDTDDTVNIWTEAYPRYIAQSSNLLYYVTLNWKEKNLQRRIPVSQLHDILNTFTSINRVLRKEKSPYKRDEKITPEELRKEVDMCNATIKMLRKVLKESEEGETRAQKTKSYGLWLALLFVIVALLYSYRQGHFITST
ncbi:hypothetical protein PROFUN_06367 [Planoprotostelium fungivorum]|uniref:Transmembrane protein n=1 Tax=Planoprotostelium fungivorum TaxID=1890364 RepID=A0A2P6NNV8_9EUKA|nr:hypothetical protein PROFUN_06367 [Planoprotostelium fungivorum]